MEDKNKFVRVAGPNKKALAELLINGKGEGRTMGQYAVECGSNRSAFSRIVNQSYKGPLSAKTIEAIAEHADPESGVTIDMLMGANGMARVLDSSTVFRDSRIEIERSFINVVLSEFEKDGRLIAYEKDLRFLIGRTGRFEPDLLIRVNSEAKGSYLWAFELILPQVDLSRNQDVGNENGFKQSVRMYGRRFVERVGMVLPLFYSIEEPIGKFSFVVTDRKAFEYLVSEYSEYYRVPFEMSLILYNAEKEVMEVEAVWEMAE